jgi:hypothetical protein
LNQKAQIYVGGNTLYNPYVGNAVLPDGPSPFSSDSTGLSIWVIVGISAGGVLLLLLILILVLYFCRRKSEESKAHDVI